MCNQVLLLTPSMRPWADSLAYAVLDEVHCINEEDGAVWERVMLLLRCGACHPMLCCCHAVLCR